MAEPSPTSLPVGVLYDDEMAGIGEIDFHTNYSFIVQITESCQYSRDFTDTYVDSFGPVTKSYDLKGWNFTKTLRYPPGTYEFDIDNICPATHVIIREVR